MLRDEEEALEPGFGQDVRIQADVSHALLQLWERHAKLKHVLVLRCVFHQQAVPPLQLPGVSPGKLANDNDPVLLQLRGETFEQRVFFMAPRALPGRGDGPLVEDCEERLLQEGLREAVRVEEVKLLPQDESGDGEVKVAPGRELHGVSWSSWDARDANLRLRVEAGEEVDHVEVLAGAGEHQRASGVQVDHAGIHVQLQLQTLSRLLLDDLQVVVGQGQLALDPIHLIQNCLPRSYFLPRVESLVLGAERVHLMLHFCHPPQHARQFSRGLLRLWVEAEVDVDRRRLAHQLDRIQAAQIDRQLEAAQLQLELTLLVHVCP
mmetsp:Transcript_9827/g.22435  ORF Transcript_9827/g.22435 Transcript_9827/m.22435 type:complete len:321 (-) Transcript_9827:1901-2863(-)